MLGDARVLGPYRQGVLDDRRQDLAIGEVLGKQDHVGHHVVLQDLQNSKN